jgi:ABC-type multidrug transport system ATPase subunit
MGPNGSGKSTLLQILWGQSLPSSGAVTYTRDEKPLAVEEIFRHISVATPYMDLVDEFTLKEQIEFHFKLKKPKAGLSISEMIERMYLQDAIEKPIGNFSSGMRQRVKLALAFFTESSLIFLDEPGTNLDKHAFQWYRNLLESRDPSSLVIIASNNPDEYPDTAQILNIVDYK